MATRTKVTKPRPTPETVERITTAPEHDPGTCPKCKRAFGMSGARLQILVALRRANQAGTKPNMNGITGKAPARTKANRAVMVLEMIHAGLIRNTAKDGRTYAFQITGTGKRLVDRFTKSLSA